LLALRRISKIEFLRDHFSKAPKAFVAGIIGAGIGWIILWLLTDIANWHYLWSAAISVFVHVSLTFWINDIWAFRHVETGKNIIRRYIEFWMTYGVGAGVEYGLIALYTSVAGVDYRLSWWAAGFTVGFLRYIGMYYWVWKKKMS